MSLWEKWEREKLEQQGIRVERKRDVEIRDTRPRPDFSKQARILCGVVLACFLTVYLALLLNAKYGGKWSDWYIVRYIVDREKLRQSQAISN